MAALPVRIVVVDDSQVYRRTLCGIIQKATDLHVVAEAENGLAAIQAVEDHRPDVVLMDVSMPVLNGIEATRIIKSKFPGTRVIVLTINADKSCSDRAYQAGACGFLAKGCGKNELFRVIEDCSHGQ
jgi:two-component system nitrate/nitrite response regulator NarL